MNGEINKATCGKCGKPVYVDKYFLYHDDGNNTMIFVYPEADRAREQEVKMEVAQSLRDSDKKIETELGELMTPEKKKEFSETGIAVVFGQDELRDLIL